MKPRTTQRVDVLLVAVNARYSSPAYGARCLAAALERAGIATGLLEVETDREPAELLDRILARAPRLVGFSVMLWNARLLRETLAMKQRIAPELAGVVGGPEIGDETAARAWIPPADAAVIGEAETLLPILARRHLAGEPLSGIFRAAPPEPDELVPPDTVYSAEDLTRRRVFVESSRGCPRHCAYCGSHASPFRPLPLSRLEEHWNRLLARGARSFHFLDRSFNATGKHGLSVLDFFLARRDPGLRLHLEFLPRRPPPAWRERLQAFPPGRLHIEIGIQSLNPEALRLAGRRPEPGPILDTLQWLCRESGAQVHADLIAGLPGDTPESLADSFDRIAALRPGALQLNLLKGLPGTPFRNNADAFGLDFNPFPPYGVIRHPAFSFRFLSRVQRAAYCWDRLYNRQGLPREDALFTAPRSSLFAMLLALSDRVVAAEGRVHSLSRQKLLEPLAAVRKMQGLPARQEEAGNSPSGTFPEKFLPASGGDVTLRP